MKGTGRNILKATERYSDFLRELRVILQIFFIKQSLDPLATSDETSDCNLLLELNLLRKTCL